MAIASIDGRFLQVNRALCAITGRVQEELEGTPIVRLLHPEDREDEAEALARLARGSGTSSRGERRWLHAAGKIVWASLNATLVRDAAGVPQHVLLQVQDVTERRRYESELRYLADHDPLTGLLNRRAFARELETHLEHVRRYGADRRGDGARPRPLQEHQRHARPRHRRRADRRARFGTARASSASAWRSPASAATSSRC